MSSTATTNTTNTAAASSNTILTAAADGAANSHVLPRLLVTYFFAVFCTNEGPAHVDLRLKQNVSVVKHFPQNSFHT